MFYLSYLVESVPLFIVSDFSVILYIYIIYFDEFVICFLFSILAI